MHLNNRVVLVTGSAVRVGRAIALHLARQGARPVVHYHTRRKEALETAADIARVKEEPLVLQGDVQQEETWLRFREQILSRYGRIDVVVNNAAIFYRTPLFQASEADWDRFMNVNLKSIFHAARILGQVMVEQKEGKIINIADVSAYTVWPYYIPYCVSKAGVIAITRGLAKALAPHVQVNAVAPGTVLLAEGYDPEEEQALIDRTPLKRIGTPEDIARTVSFLIEGSDFITGEIIHVDGGRSIT